eukprot:TRINITY_DN24749_c0_g3_i1.p1 TRINITY_DN24749_c0_g3~~TRINITY_DN24749_c0_g3_i1.p1  ORF type:complete len:521 (-),score=63.68 TRINITY_DN24749_c0_g3_i1:218-1612(-)
MNMKAKQLLVDDAIVWASQHGLLYRLGGDAPEAATIHAPMSLLPCPLPAAEFNKAKELMPTLNSLVDEISKDGEYLYKTLELAAQEDQFTKDLLEVYDKTEQVRKQIAKQGREIVLGIHRSDYMLDDPSGKLLQVELNTISSSFGCLGNIVSSMHRYLFSKLGKDNSCLPENDTTFQLCFGIAKAWKAYSDPKSIVLMVTQPGEKNTFDQDWLSTTLWDKFRIQVVRTTLYEVSKEATLTSTNQLRFLDLPVSVVYLRAGYTPSDYPTQTEWDGRTKLESSDAAKCPSIAYQLTGAKKIQQDLAQPGVVEKFIQDNEQAAKVRELFAGLWSLDDLQDQSTKQVIQKAIESPQDFVLKPQREGGGNNLYDEDLRQRLSNGGNQLAACILMQRIKPPKQQATLVRRGEWIETEALSELGIYGTFVRKADEVLLNATAGHLIRTKASTSNEGGVAAGFAVLDSPQLV